MPEKRQIGVSKFLRKRPIEAVFRMKIWTKQRGVMEMAGNCAFEFIMLASAMAMNTGADLTGEQRAAMRDCYKALTGQDMGPEPKLEEVA